MDDKRRCYNDFGKNDWMNVDAFPLSGKSLVVRVPNKNILESIKDFDTMDRGEVRGIYRSIIESILDADIKNIIERLKAKEAKAKEDWQNLKDDIILGYCVRYVLHGKEIPILENDPYEKGDDIDELCV